MACWLAVFIFVWVLQGCATSTSSKQIEKGLDASENIASENAEGDAKAEADHESQAEDRDPLEGFNRSMFSFNEKVDDYVAEPITIAYKWITPDFVQKGISNFFTNTKNINVVLNDVFQGKFAQSAKDTGRFLVNTTVGVVGLFDVASHIGLEQHDEDFDQTLAFWGVPKGAYLVLPILGPSTARGIPGSVVDTAANPITYVGLPAQVLAMLNARANAEGALKFIDEAALDPYVFTRESFLQWRDYLATDGAAKASTVNDEFEDDLEENIDDASSASQPSAAAKPAAASPAPAASAAAGQSLTKNSGNNPAGAANAGGTASQTGGAGKLAGQSDTVLTPVLKEAAQPTANNKDLAPSAEKVADAPVNSGNPGAPW